MQLTLGHNISVAKKTFKLLDLKPHFNVEMQTCCMVTRINIENRQKFAENLQTQAHYFITQSSVLKNGKKRLVMCFLNRAR